VDWQTVQQHHSLGAIRRLALFPQESRPAASTRPFLGPLVTWLRSGLWKLMGMREAVAAQNARLVEVLTELETTRPLVRYQGPEHALHFREGTGDWFIFYDVYFHNSYELPEQFEPDDVVIDIGTHIGSLAYLALVRGAGRVYGFEPDRSNFEVARRNLQVFGDRACLSNQAVWRSDRSSDAVFAPAPPPGNSGGGCLLWSEKGAPAEVVALDAVLDQVTEGGNRRVRLLKIDCEGAEFPILLTSRKLHLVDQIAGEYHELVGNPVPERALVPGVARYDCAAITTYLEKAGFHVRVVPDLRSPGLGLFFATRA
jgi:FkbM family methyltransferase